jgi:hypothetical protein
VIRYSESFTATRKVQTATVPGNQVDDRSVNRDTVPVVIRLVTQNLLRWPPLHPSLLCMRYGNEGESFLQPNCFREVAAISGLLGVPLFQDRSPVVWQEVYAQITLSWVSVLTQEVN